MDGYISLNTRTQKQYDDLMVSLEERGYFWGTGNVPTDFPEYWAGYKENTCISINPSINPPRKNLSYGHIKHCLSNDIANLNEYMEKWKKVKVFHNYNKELIAAINNARENKIGK